MNHHRIIGVLALLFIIAGCQSNNSNDLSTQDANQLTIISWGGIYQRSQQKAIFEAFEKRNPLIKLNIDSRANEALNILRNKALSRSLGWDVIDMTAEDASIACKEGLLLNLKDSQANMDLVDKVRSVDGLQCAVPSMVFSMPFAYRIGTWGARKPTTIRDFFNISRFPGKRGLQKKPENNLVWALIADGVKPENVYQVLETDKGLNRAFRKLNTIKRHILWWDNELLPTNWLASEKVAFTSAYNTTIFDAITANNERIAYMWDWQVLDLDAWVIPATSVRQIRAKAFIEFASQPEILADQASYINYGPASIAAATMIKDNPASGLPMGKYAPTAPENMGNYLMFNYDWWRKNRVRIQTRFDQWLEQ